jgi:hypothetical protein
MVNSNPSSTSENPTEYSLNDIAKLSPFELSNKIFTYDKRLQNGDLSKINEVRNDKLDEIISGLKCMKGYEDNQIPKFSFFQFKKCRVNNPLNKSYKFMLCFNDIS